MRKLTLLVSFVALTFSAGCGDGDDTTTDGTEDTIATEDTASDDDTSTDDDTTDLPLVCNPITQTGCGDAGNCTFSGEDDKPSCAAAGTVAAGDECGGANTCVEGICLSLNDTGSRCYKFCQTPVHCPDLGACLDLSNAAFSVCEVGDIYDNCDLLQQNCDGGKGCYAIDNEPLPVCLPAGSGVEDSECESVNDCGSGFVCVNRRCKTICDQGAAQPCGTFGNCSAWAGNAGYCDE